MVVAFIHRLVSEQSGASRFKFAFAAQFVALGLWF